MKFKIQKELRIAASSPIRNSFFVWVSISAYDGLVVGYRDGSVLFFGGKATKRLQRWQLIFPVL